MTDHRLTTTVRVYHALLRLLLPPRFRSRFSHHMLHVFAALDEEARANGGRRAAWRALRSELPGLLTLSAHERAAERTTVARQPHTPTRPTNMLASLSQDLRFAFRSLRRSVGFTVVAVLTLALGVGANTAIFSVINGVLLRPLPLARPEQLYLVGEASLSVPGAISVTTPANLYDLKNSIKSMQIAGFNGVRGTVTGKGEPQVLTGYASVGGILQVLGVQPIVGRLLTEADEDPASPRVIVLSYATWRDLFGEDRAAVGQSVTMNGTARTIVGVMPPGFAFPDGPSDFYVPSRYDAEYRANRDQYSIQAIGRLAPDTRIEQAHAELDVMAARLQRDWPVFNTNLRMLTQPLQESIVGGARTQLLVLMAAVVFVLLITCVNLGNLLLARASVRRREIAIRQALGAGRVRVVRQLMTESVLLAILGGAAGLLVGQWFLKLLLAAQVTTNLPRAEEIALDGRVLLFTLAVSVFAGLFFGSIPALQLARGGSSDVLRDGTRGSTGSTGLRGALVVAEVALAMVLLTGAGLLLRSFDLLSRVDPGVRPDHVLTFSVATSNQQPPFFLTALDRLRALPGVQSAALTSTIPVSGRGIGAWLNRLDKPFPPGVKPTGAPYRVVTPDYFATVGIALRRGRLLNSSDRLDAPAVVINEALVKAYYPGEEPLGREIYLGAPDNRLFERARIVGVVADTRDAGLGVDALPTVYIPQAVMPRWTFFSFVVRTSGEPTSIAGSVRSIIRELDPNVPVRNVESLETVISNAMASTRWSMTLLGVFAGVALVIAVLGVFGVLSFIVTQRTRELGIRIALGAAPAQVRRMVVTRGVLLVSLGVMLGVAGSVALTRFMGSLLYGVTPTDPLTLVGVAVVLAASAIVASYLPARRATKVDPLVALRAE